MTPTAWPRRALVFLIELYRTWISPTRLPSCRFEPTCSAYAVEAVTEWGAVRGGALSVVRLAKCGPWHKPGYDPVPVRSGHHGGRTVGSGPDPVPARGGPDPADEVDERVYDAGHTCVSDADDKCVPDAVRST